MELRQLEHLVAVVDEQGFTRAAQRLHVTQSTLSASLKRLEQELGVPLLDRGPHHLRLTVAGTTFLVEARRTLAAAAAARASVQTHPGELRGRLRIGVMQHVAMINLAGLLSRYRQDHPRARLEPSAPPGGSASLVRGVRHGEMDIAIAVAGPDATGVTTRLLARDRLVLVCPAGHEWAGASSLAIRDLAGGRFVELPTGWGLRQLTDQLFAAAGTPREIAVEAPDSGLVFDLVTAGLGCAIAPRFAMPATASLVAVPLLPATAFDIHLVTPADRPLTPQAGALAALAPRFVTPPPGPGFR